MGNGGYNGGSMVEMVFNGGQCWERWLIVVLVGTRRYSIMVRNGGKLMVGRDVIVGHGGKGESWEQWATVGDGG